MSSSKRREGTTSIAKQLNLDERCTASCYHIMDDLGCFRSLTQGISQTEQVKHIPVMSAQLLVVHPADLKAATLPHQCSCQQPCICEPQQLSLHLMVLLSPPLPGSRGWSCNDQLPLEDIPIDVAQVQDVGNFSCLSCVKTLSMRFIYVRMMTMHGFQVMLLAVWSCWVVYYNADLHIRILPELCSYLNSHMPVDTGQ